MRSNLNHIFTIKNRLKSVWNLTELTKPPSTYTNLVQLWAACGRCNDTWVVEIPDYIPPTPAGFRRRRARWLGGLARRAKPPSRRARPTAKAGGRWRDIIKNFDDPDDYRAHESSDSASLINFSVHVASSTCGMPGKIPVCRNTSVRARKSKINFLLFPLNENDEKFRKKYSLQKNVTAAPSNCPRLFYTTHSHAHTSCSWKTPRSEGNSKNETRKYSLWSSKNRRNNHKIRVIFQRIGL